MMRMTISTIITATQITVPTVMVYRMAFIAVVRMIMMMLMIMILVTVRVTVRLMGIPINMTVLVMNGITVFVW